MKKLLLSLLTVLCISAINAQTTIRDLWFNEMFTTPVQSNSEFIEMYNTSNTDISLDCYIIVSYVAPGTTGFGTQGGAYIYNFPTNAKISALSYYLLASNSQLKFKGSGNKTVNPSDATKFSNWSQPITGGYLTKYTYNGTTWTNAGAPTTTEMQNIMPGDGALLLYKINSDGTTSLVNGVFGGNLPTAVPNLSDLTNLPSSSSCFTGNVTLKFKNQGISANTVDIASVAASTGQDHGYAKIGNGLCGSWAKTQTASEFTPGEKNPTSLGTVTLALTTTQSLTCGNQINFSITAPTSGTVYPVTVLLYIDKNKDGILDGAVDEYVATYPNTISSGSNTVYTFTGLASLPASQQYLVVYRTALGCYDHVAAPAIATGGTFTTTERTICGNTVDFAVTGTTGDAATYGLPLSVQLYEDAGTSPGVLDAGDVAIGSAVPVTSVSNTKYSITIPDANKGKLYILVYSSPSPCYSKTVVPSPAQITLNTTQTNVCGNFVAVSATGATLAGSTLDPAAYTLPITAELHLDANGDQVYDPNDPTEAAVLNSASITSFSTTSYQLPIPTANRNDKFIIVYRTSQACFTTAVVPSPAAIGSLNTTQNYFCGKRIDFSVTGATTNDATIYSLPITVQVFYDANGNGVLDLANGEDTTNNNGLLGSTTINAFSANTQQIALAPADYSKAVIIVYKATNICFSKTVVPTNTATGPIEASGSLSNCNDVTNGKRNVSYFMVNNNSAADAYPVLLEVYEDANKNGVIDNGEVAIGQQTITTAPATGTPNTIYKAQLNTSTSWAVVKATSINGCSQFIFQVENNCIALPVHFASFTATRNKGNVNLKWETATEINNRGFNVQRNVRGEWKTIAFVFSQAANGNSSSLLSYEYKDANMERGVTQYRIQQVDLDDKASYSEIRSVMGLEQASSMMVFPNPSHDGKVNVLFSNPSVREVMVSDAAGRIIRQYQQVTGTNFTIEKLPAGFFAIKVIDRTTGTIAVEKVIVK